LFPNQDATAPAASPTLAPNQGETALPVPPPVASQPLVMTTTTMMNDEAPAPTQVEVNMTDPPIPPIVQIPAQQQHVSVSSSDPALQVVHPTFNAQLQALQDQVASLTRLLQTPARPSQPPLPDMTDDDVVSTHMDGRVDVIPPY
jgi:hypothetical protein